MRLCPKCGVKTEEARCPDDGTATLALAQNPESRLAMGTEINGRYRVDQLIGQGGFGAVYKSTHLATEQEMAIKVLGVSLDDDDSDLIQRFFAEAQITAGLKHPNTIRVFDFGQTEGGALYIAMELLTGQDLNQVLKERRGQGKALSEGETIRIASQTLRSLAEAHMAGLVHRDLKPHNIFLNEVPGDDPVVKVLDFGIAKRLGTNLTGTGQAFGTPSYMSPEQAQNKPVDARSDIYSLGAVMYQCVAGACPFDGDNPLAVLLAHVTDVPPDLRERSQSPVSEAFIQIIEKALAKSPDARFESAISMRQALTTIESGGALDAIGAPTRMGVAPLEPRIERGSAGHSLPIEVDDAGTDDRTAAYTVPSKPSAKAAAAEVGAVGAPSAPGAVEAGGSGRTEAFFVRNDATEHAAAEPAAASSDVVYEDLGERKSSAGLGLLIALALGFVVVAGAAAAVVLNGGDEGEAPEAVAQAEAAPAPAKAEPVPAPAENAADAGTGADATAAATADAGAPKDTAPKAPAIVHVEVRTEPAGAKVSVDGKLIGKAPVKVEVTEGKPIRASLALNGYQKTETVLMHTDRDGRTVKLTRLKPVRAARKPKPRKVKAGPTPRPRPTTPSPRPRKSALEERL